MNSDKLMTIEEAASYLNCQEKTLANWRSAGTGPKFYKPTEKLVYYYQEDLDAWIKSGGSND